MSLRGKKILITAGPTWVALDAVRVISNIASGKTGLYLAEEARRQGAEVTLILGPVCQCGVDKSVNIIHFKFFDDLKSSLMKQLRGKKYDIIIHSAAVSDFKAQYKLRGKFNSDRAHNLKLVPLEKLVVLIRRLVPKAKLVMCVNTVEDVDRILNGKKQKAFFHNLYLPIQSQRVTIDRHAISIALGRPAKDNELQITHNQYDWFADCYRRLADKLGIRPSLLQSITWEHWRVIK